jgi:hypothetical protein
VLDEDGLEQRIPVKAGEEEQHRVYVEACKRELEGCKRRLLELDEMAKSPGRWGCPPDRVIEDAEQAKAAVVCELKRLAELDKPKATKGRL